MDVKAYLSRIGYRGGTEPTAANLAALVRAHRLAVPYETLDIWRGRHTTLATDELFDKIVTRRRGGYCFELNGLFAALLRELGYNVREYFGRWHFGEEAAIPKRRHRVPVVALPGHPNVIADVGIGLPFLTGPLDLVFAVPQQVDGKTYRIIRDETLSAVVEAKRRDGSWTRLFSFDTAPQLPIDFAYVHYWCETHPTSVFRRGLSAFLPNADGSYRAIAMEPDAETGEPVPTLHLAPADGGVPVKRALHGEAALAATLKEHFGIVEDGAAASRGGLIPSAKRCSLYRKRRS